MTHRLTGGLRAFMLGTSFLALGVNAAEPNGMNGEGFLRIAANESELPLSADALFDISPETKDGASKNDAKQSLPASKDALFDVDPAPDKAGMASKAQRDSKALLLEDNVATVKSKAGDGTPYSPPQIRGFFQTELARTTSSPDHWSKFLGRLELGTQGNLGKGSKWKLSGRLDYNAVYDLTDFYQSQVRNDQRVEFQLRETYLDFSTGTWDWRVGRQHVVWGEMVGLFFADVVSAKDLREFILPDFQVLRIPQWAARAEYFNDDFHAEVVWIPFPSYDEFGKPKDFTRIGSGADFYPYPPAVAPTILGEVKPGTSLDHTNFGLRVTQLTNGWDLSGFYYTSMNSSPTYYQYAPNVFTPKHDRIWQLGGTLAKDLSDFVLKAEAVYTNGRRFNLLVASPDGVVQQNTLDWVVGLDFNPSSDTRVNTQLFQRYFFNHNPNIIPDKTENGASLLVSHSFQDNWKAEALLVHSLNRRDWMFRPKASWGFQPNWKLSFGLDLFGGPNTGLFGQYDAQDRAYAEVRYDF